MGDVAVVGSEWRGGEEWTSVARHPWLDGADWFVAAGDRLVDWLGDDASFHVATDHQRDREPTYRVVVNAQKEQDELDEAPGLRRIERRAGELAPLLPAKPPFSAKIVFTRREIAVQLRWHLHGQAALLSQRRGAGWLSADMIMMPTRHLQVPDELLVARDHRLLLAVDRKLGGGRIAPRAKIHSATRRGEEIRIVIDAGGVLRPGSNEAA